MKQPAPIRRILALALTACLLLGGALAASAEEPLAVTMYLGCGVVEFPPDGNEIEKIIEAYAGVDMKINAYSGSVLHEMMPTLIAGGDLPMVVNVGGSQLSKSYLINAMKAGEFWDVTDYIYGLDNFKDLNPLALNNYAIEGRLYGLPLERGLSRDALTYRYDWLQNLGLEEPKTVDGMVNMWLAFTKDDPDGNGVNDTYGVVTSGLTFLDQIAIHLGAPNNWRYEDGVMTKMQLTEEYAQALDICRMLYAEGAVHPEFAIRERADYEGDFISGKSGSYYDVSTGISAFQSRIANPNAVLHASNLFANGKGEIFTSAGRGNNGVLLFSKKAIPDKETLDKVINLFDRLADEEMCNLLALGVEGTNYEVVDGVARMLPENDAYWQEKIHNPYSIPLAVRWPILRTMPVEYDYGDQRNLEIIQENAPYAVADPTLGLISELYNDLGGDLDTLLRDAATLYIMGEIDKEEFNNRMEKWKKQGGDDIAADFARLYQEKNR